MGRGRKGEKEKALWFPPLKDDGDYLGVHHVVPRFRGGHDAPWNSWSWGDVDELEVKHKAWHQLFGAMKPSEAKKYIHSLTAPSGRLLREKLSENKRRAWDVLFGDHARSETAIAWIDRNFMRTERRWQRILRRSWAKLFDSTDLAAAKKKIRDEWYSRGGALRIDRMTDTQAQHWTQFFGGRETSVQKALKVIDDRHAGMMRGD